ncbi:Endoglucanase [Rhodopirellula islandica]|uniref:Endoglucanase n=2 Tax=Rhodopirellula islandica TaxID=595434 RepID=A0A0J1B961_RHOIS|nr:Endoglucanase [Rhodopirellula islandica]
MRPIYWGPCLFVVVISLMRVHESSQADHVLKQDFPTSIGVSIAGPEFGTHHSDFSNANPGVFEVDYTYPGASTIEPLAQRGIRLMRLPVRWERLQPALGEELDPQELDRLVRTIAQVRASEARVIIDLHNYGRYRTLTARGPRDCIIDQRIDGQTPVSSEHLADLWTRLAIHFHDNSTVIAYGLMNEPHDMGRSKWDEISQRSVDAIRAVDQQTWLLVAGDAWSSTEKFSRVNGPDAWINDATGRVLYEGHCYLDHDSSGQYKLSFAEEAFNDPSIRQRPAKRLQPFVEWCQQNRVRGFVGEFGVPVDDANWNDLFSEMLVQMDQADLGGCVWAAGPWWADYPLSVEVGHSKELDPLSLRKIVERN